MGCGCDFWSSRDHHLRHSRIVAGHAMPGPTLKPWANAHELPLSCSRSRSASLPKKTAFDCAQSRRMTSRRNAPNVLDLLSFFIDRLKVYLRDRGARYDLIDAALGAIVAPSSDPARRATSRRRRNSQAQDDLVMITTKVEALSKFLDTDDGKNLLAGFRRAVNILKIEEKKDGAGAYDQHHEPNLRIEPQEHKLAAAIARAREETAEKLHKEDFEGAMRSAGEAARAGRRLLRSCDGQRREQGPAPQPPAPAERAARRDARRRGFRQDRGRRRRGVIPLPACGERVRVRGRVRITQAALRPASPGRRGTSRHLCPKPLTPPLSPRAGRGSNARRLTHPRQNAPISSPSPAPKPRVPPAPAVLSIAILR